MATDNAEMPDFWDVTQLLMLNHGSWVVPGAAGASTAWS